MAVWLIRAGKYGEDESTALEQGLSIIGWREMPDLSGVASYEEMKDRHVEVYPDMSPKAVSNHAAQVWAFVRRIQVGDIAVLPLKTRFAVAMGRVTGEYDYRNGRHVRPVDWIREEVPRKDFGQDLLYSLGAFMTVCRIRRNNAEARINTIIEGKIDPGLTGKLPEAEKTEGITDDSSAEKEIFVDLEEQSFDQIRKLIEAKFKGHGMALLVESVLKMQGYQTFRSPEGADGGIDILAGFGPMGFENPRVCVQVKSGGVQNDNAIRELEGVMSRIGAEQGLFVSWDGFNKTAQTQAKQLFFKVRLWDDRRLITAILENYDALPDYIQAELPLKRIWAVVLEE